MKTSETQERFARSIVVTQSSSDDELMKNRLASQALLPQIRAQVRNTSMLNKLVQAL